MKRSVLLAVLVLVVSCGLREIGYVDNDSEGVWVGPGAAIGSGGMQSSHKTMWYLTAFDYPDSYDWRSDQWKGSVKCSLVVYVNMIPMMKVPVGDEYMVSSDPDMHRIIDGDLYTDFVKDSVTIIKKNGKLLFSYSGREMLLSMHVDSSSVYTVGQSRSGRGLSFRRNGEIIYENKTGILLGLPDRDRFAYAEQIQNAAERYYFYDSGKISQIALREDLRRVWDVQVSSAGVAYLASLVGVSSPVVISDGKMYSLNVPIGMTVQTCRFVQGQQDVVEGVCLSTRGSLTSVLWRNGEREYMFSSGMTVASICSWEDGISCVLKNQKTDTWAIYRCGELFNMPQDYAVMGSSSMAVVDGILHIGMTSKLGENALIWKDGQVDTLKINGYISGVYAH